MTDEPKDDAASANAAAELLLRLSVASAAPTLAKAEALLGDQPNVPLFREIIRLEVGGSMAMERLAQAYSRAVITEVETIGDRIPGKGAHVLRAMANIYIGGLLAFVDDMPDKLRNEFLRTFADGMNAGLMLRARSKTAETKKRSTH